MADQEKDIVRVTFAVDADQMLAGYARGEFPMHYIGPAYYWMSPRRRGVLPLDNLRVTRSLRKSMKRYETTFDADFLAVLSHCAGRGSDGDWIDAGLMAAYVELHARGYAHSVEVWDRAGDLAGGLFVVNLGGLVAGESMFHIGRDASKTALVALVERLRPDPGPILIDTQWSTAHLATLGVIEIPGRQYVRQLPGYLNRPNAL